MTTTERITVVRRQLVHQQGGICARCGQPLRDAVHLARLRPISDGGGPALVSAGNLVVVHPTCTIVPDLRHTFYVPCCGCANCAQLKAQGDRDAERTPRGTSIAAGAAPSRASRANRRGSSIGTPSTTPPGWRSNTWTIARPVGPLGAGPVSATRGG